MEIKRLPESLVNKIAAGEVVTRPAAAIKEMIENSIDALSTHIGITIKEGGLKLISICDNGKGIQEQDLPILCHRFTTSKIQDYKDLTSILTFGFWGEALASISLVSHVEVITMSETSNVAFKAVYEDGNMISKTLAAGNPGTMISVKDLFFNNRQRKESLNPKEETDWILKLVQCYALHYPHINFSLKRLDDGKPLLNTEHIQKSEDS